MSYNTLNEALAALADITSTGEALKAALINLVKQVSVQAQNVSADATTAVKGVSDIYVLEQMNFGF
jgi:hypothetical protein